MSVGNVIILCMSCKNVIKVALYNVIIKIQKISLVFLEAEKGDVKTVYIGIVTLVI